MLSVDSPVTAADVFTMLDTDSSDAITIGLISKKLGHDMRNRSKLQNLFPDLQRLFLLAEGDPEHPEQVVVCAKHWNTYWDAIGSDLRTRKLTELCELIDQHSSAGLRVGSEELRPIKCVQTRHEVNKASVCARSIVQRTLVNIADIESEVAGPEASAVIGHSAITATVTLSLPPPSQALYHHHCNTTL